MRARLGRTSEAIGRRPWLAVAIAYTATAGYLAARVAKVDEYIWFVDELLYVKVAQGFAGGELLRAEVYDGAVGLPNSLYPRLLAPLYALLPSVDAFDAAHVLNALLFASVIVPVYLLARRLEVPWGLALLAGLVCAWVPWSVAAGVLMTESLAYPAFAWALLAIVAAIDDPRPRNHLLALLAIGVAAFARTQLALLLGVLVVGIVLEALARQNADSRRGAAPRPRVRELLRPHLPLALLLGAVAAATAVLAAAGTDPLGIYGVAVESTRFPEDWLGAAGRHLGTVIVGIGVLPAVLWVAWAARVVVLPRARADLAFAIAGALAVGALVYAAADFAQNISGGTTQERYLFYVVPVFVVGAVALLADAREPTPRLSLVAAGLLVAVVVTVPRYGTPEFGAAFGYIAAAASGFHPVVVGRSDQLTTLLPGGPFTTAESMALLAVVLGVVAVPLMRVAWRPVVAPALMALVLLFTAAETVYVLDRALPGINTHSQRLPGVPQTPRAWADEQLDGDAEVGAVPGPIIEPPQPVEREIWLRAEFWNERIQTSYRLPERTNYTDFPSLPLTPDAASGRVTTPRELPYLVMSATDPGLRLRGEVVAEAAYGLQLIRPQRPYRALWLAEGGFVDGYTKGTRPRRFHLYEPQERVRFDLTAPGTAERRVGYVIRAGERTLRGTVKPGFTGSVQLTLDPGVREIVIRPDLSTTIEGGQRVGIRVGPLELG